MRYVMKPRDGLVLRQKKIGCINQVPQFHNDPMWPVVLLLLTLFEDWCKQHNTRWGWMEDCFSPGMWRRVACYKCADVWWKRTASEMPCVSTRLHGFTYQKTVISYMMFCNNLIFNNANYMVSVVVLEQSVITSVRIVMKTKMVTMCTMFYIQKQRALPTQCICVIRKWHRMKNQYSRKYHWLIGLGMEMNCVFCEERMELVNVNLRW